MDKVVRGNPQETLCGGNCRIGKLSEGNTGLTPSEGKREARSSGKVLDDHALKRRCNKAVTELQAEIVCQKSLEPPRESCVFAPPLCRHLAGRNLWETWSYTSMIVDVTLIDQLDE